MKPGAYRLYNPIKHTVTLSRDVIVCESEAWDWSKKNIVQLQLFH
jgi:hypothetical protein